MVLNSILSCVADIIKEPINEYIISPIVRHFGYAFHCDTEVEELEQKVKDLKEERLRVQQSVEKETGKGKEIHEEVPKWLGSSAEKIKEAEELMKRKEEYKKKKYIGGFCPNCNIRYQLGKEANEIASTVGEQLKDSPGSDGIAFSPRLQQIVEPSVYTSEALPSRLLILKQIMDALRDPKLNMIGVHGMAGVGKTTLVNEVQLKATEENLFETVIRVAVSKTQDINEIQGEIAFFLGLEFRGEGVHGRASQLHQRLKGAKVLIILDDLWQKVDLNAVGIPLEDASPGCKILLTSRSKDVLSCEMLTEKEFSLGVLNEEEAWRLFKKSASEDNDTQLPAVAAEIAKKCAGLPLLILLVATKLRNKEAHVWREMLNQLNNLENADISDKVHNVIESSY